MLLLYSNLLQVGVNGRQGDFQNKTYLLFQLSPPFLRGVRGDHQGSS